MPRPSRLKIAGAIAPSADVASAPVPVPDVAEPLGATIDDSLIVDAQPDVATIAEAVKPRAKKDEPRQATAADFNAQSLRNHAEHVKRAAAIAALEAQLKNL